MSGRIITSKAEWRSYNQARAYVRKLGLKSHLEWRRYAAGKIRKLGSRPADIPANPQSVYKNYGWTGYGDWLGSENVAYKKHRWRSFQKARAFVRSLGLKSNAEWRRYVSGELSKAKKPIDIPTNPNFVYKDKGWISYGDWLGSGNVSTRDRSYWPYDKARTFVRKLGLINEGQWRQYVKGELPKLKKKPDHIPANPSASYKNKGWAGFGDWLGTGNLSYHDRQWRPFGKARWFVRRLGLKSSTEWRQYCKGELKRKGKKPVDIPATPYAVYKDSGWKDMADWLGV